MPELTVSTSIAGLLALLMVPLSLQVSLKRVNLGVVFGDANDADLRRKIRAHGNFIEYAATGLVVLALLEYHVGTNVAIWVLGAALLASRILHAVGMLYCAAPTPRAIAMMTSHAFFLVAGVWLLIVLRT